MSHIFVLASVDESDIGGVNKGQDVDITADAFPGKHFAGRSSASPRTGVNTSNVVTFEVKIEVTSANKQLAQAADDGQRARSSRPAAKTCSRFRCWPSCASSRRRYVTVVKPDGSTEEREVTLGINDGDNQEILSGLSERRAGPGSQERLQQRLVGRGTSPSESPALECRGGRLMIRAENLSKPTSSADRRSMRWTM